MKAMVIAAAAASITLLSEGAALACDKLTPNCTPENIMIDSAQKGPVQPDPLQHHKSGREYIVRLPND